jgi:hypothetical protein
MKFLVLLSNIILFSFRFEHDYLTGDITNEQYEREARIEILSINIDDGVDFSEASILFDVYGYCYFENNGWGDLTDNGSYWVGEVTDHWSDEPLGQSVIINKSTGDVMWEFGPTVNFTDFVSGSSVGVSCKINK